MIGKLTGRLDEIAHGAVIIDVGGVGYEVTVGARTLSRLPAIGESVSLAIDTHMRDDAIKLYGFATEHERAWFRALQTVQGVGAKVALAVLGILDADRPRQCRGAPGQGAGRPRPGRRAEGRRAHRRRAQGQDAGARACHPAGAWDRSLPSALPEAASARDAVSALTNLGYAHAQASAAISLAVGKAGREARTEELIRLGLKELAQ